MTFPRKTDIGLILTCLLIMGSIYSGFYKPFEWDEAVKKIDLLEPEVIENAKEIAEIKSVQTTQMSLIIRELDGMHRDLRDIKKQGSGG